MVWGNPADPASFPPGDFDIVIDNNGKDIDSCKPLIDAYGSKASTCSPPPLTPPTPFLFITILSCVVARFDGIVVIAAAAADKDAHDRNDM